MVKLAHTLDTIDVREKRVLVRIDINSDVHNKRIIPSPRLTAPLTTIRELQKKKARIVLIAHQGRRDKPDCISLEQHARFMKNYLPALQFVPDLAGRKAQDAINNLKPAHVLLLENLRFENEEQSDASFVRTLAPFFDYYINDAFSASHRHHASIVGFPQYIPSVMGRLFEAELTAADTLKVNRATLILGGVKPDDTIELITATKGPILPTGFLGPLVLEAQGIDLGAQSLVMKEFRSLIPFIKKNLHRFIAPVDVALDVKGDRLDLPVEELPSDHLIHDVGVRTLALYEKKIRQSKAIFMKGLPGLCNTPPFTRGTDVLLKAVARSKSFSILSGGHTTTWLNKLGISQNAFGYVSLSGGALVHYLAHKKLPGIEAI